MMLVTIDSIPGKEYEVLGIVKGTIVQSKNFGRDFMAAVKTLIGGEIAGYTEMLNEAGNLKGLFPYMINHLGKNATLGLFKTMTMEQLIFVGAYAILAYPLFIINDKLYGRFIERILFSKREFKDE